MPYRPLVISHRTQAGTMPENTLAGIDAALAMGVDGIEIDVRATSDGVVLLSHDATLERVAGDPRAVSDLTHAELREVTVLPAHGVEGERVPTLAEAYERIAGRAILVVEVKQEGIHELVAAEVRRAQAEASTWIWAFDPGVANACRRVIPQVPTSLLHAPGTLERFGHPETPIEIAVEAGFAAISWAHASLDAARVAEAKRRGLAVYSWTVNGVADIARIVDAGADGICSDFPDRVQAALGAGGA